MGQTVQSLMVDVDRRMKLLKLEGLDGMGEMAVDTFTVLDRRELMKQGLQLEQILKEVSDVRTEAKEEIDISRHSTAAHEARLRVLEDSRFTVAHEARMRALEDSRLTLQTQIKAALWWIALLSACISTAASFIIKFFGK